MIQIKKPKYEHDNYCVCCRKPFEDSMQISFSHKNYKDSVSITLCGKCREELRKALAKDIDVPIKWIPVSEKLPEEPFGCLVTVWDEQPMTGEMFENLLPYFVGWDGEQWNNGDGMQCPFEIIAWMPLPEPWKGEG